MPWRRAFGLFGVALVAMIGAGVAIIVVIFAVLPHDMGDVVRSDDRAAIEAARSCKRLDDLETMFVAGADSVPADTAALDLVRQRLDEMGCRSN